MSSDLFKQTAQRKIIILHFLRVPQKAKKKTIAHTQKGKIFVLLFRIYDLNDELNKTEHLRILQQKHIHHRNTKCDNPPPLPSHKVVQGEGTKRRRGEERSSERRVK